MSNENEIEIVETLLRMGFDRQYIIWVLINLEYGYGLGSSMAKAIYQTARNKPFPHDEDNE